MEEGRVETSAFEMTEEVYVCERLKSAKAGKHKILLAEDHAANVLITSTFLENLGYSCDVASDGREAVEKAKTGSYALILMDVRMPGMDGLEASRQLRLLEKQGSIPGMPIIAITANALSEDREKCLHAGMNDYISKPFTEEELEQTIRKNISLFAR